MIPEWVCTNVVNFERENSRAYISNIITCEIFWLQNESSDLWYKLIGSSDIKEVEEYAKQRNLIDELPEFLSLLQSKGLYYPDDVDKSVYSNNVPKSYGDLQKGIDFRAE